MLYTEPYSGPTPIVEIVHEAKKRISIDAYELDDTAVLDAIRGAVHRGVIVQVMIAPHPRGRSESWIRNEFHRLVVTGTQVRWSPFRFSHHYAIDHAHIVVDDQGNGPGLIDSQNFTWRAIYHSLGDLWLTHNQEVTHALAEVFDADWTRHHAGTAPRRRLVVSPGSSVLLAHLLIQPGNVDLETKNFGFLPRVIKALEHKGHKARIILPATLSTYDHGNLKPVLKAGVQVRYLHHTTQQGLLIAGRKRGFIGSQNLSWSILHSSRDVGIVIRGRHVASLRAAFNRDWHLATPIA